MVPTKCTILHYRAVCMLSKGGKLLLYLDILLLERKTNYPVKVPFVAGLLLSPLGFGPAYSSACKPLRNKRLWDMWCALDSFELSTDDERGSPAPSGSSSMCARRVGRHFCIDGVSTSTNSHPVVYLKILSFCDRYACGHRCVSGQVTRCGAAVMALTTPRLFSVTVLTVLVGLVSSSQDHEWHFNPGENKIWWNFVFLLFFIELLFCPEVLPHLKESIRLHKHQHNLLFKPSSFFFPCHPCIYGTQRSPCPAPLTFSTHSQISKAYSPSAINRLSCVPQPSASQSCVTGEWDSRTRPPAKHPPTRKPQPHPLLVKTANAQAAHESVNQNVGGRERHA